MPKRILGARDDQGCSGRLDQEIADDLRTTLGQIEGIFGDLEGRAAANQKR